MNPLSISLNTGDAKTAIPLIIDGQKARFRLTEIGQINDEAGAPTRIKFKCVLIDPAPLRDGGTVQPGFPVFTDVPTKTKDSAEMPAWAVTKVSNIMDACLGTGDKDNTKGKPARPTFDNAIVPALIGKEFVATVKIKKNNETGYESNDLTSFTFMGDVAGA